MNAIFVLVYRKEYINLFLLFGKVRRQTRCYITLALLTNYVKRKTREVFFIKLFSKDTFEIFYVLITIMKLLLVPRRKFLRGWFLT